MDSSLVLLFLLTAATANSCVCGMENTSYYKEVYPPVDLSDNLSNHLFFALIQSFSGSFNGSGSIPGIQVAMDRINDMSDILPNHTLHYTLTDSQCVRTTALDALFTQLLSEDGIQKVAVVGSGCSLATEPTAEVSHYYNVTHISCTTASNEVVDRKRFRRYFQLLQVMADIAPIYLGLAKHYGWRHVSIITQNENLFRTPMDILKESLEANNISYSEAVFETTAGLDTVKHLINPETARIFILASYVSHARSFLCEAYRKDIRYPGYLIILMGWYQGEWWLKDDDDCTPDDKKTILSRSLSVHHFNFFVPEDRNTKSGINGSEFNRENKLKITGPPSYGRNPASPYCYDAIWTLAYALDQTIKENPNIAIEYSNDDFHRGMFNLINSSNFTGITGPVQFNSDGIRATNMRQVFQILKDESGIIEFYKVGEVKEREQGEFIFQNFSTDKVIWPDGIPQDGVRLNTTVTVHIDTTVIFTLLASSGIAFTIVCLIFNCYFRNKTLIKLGSPNLNYLICVGAIILYIDVYLLSVPTTNPFVVEVLCHMTPWLTAIGYSLCYGTIVVKMIRVHLIFTNPKPNSKSNLKDWKLALGVLSLVVIDLLILVTYSALEGSNGIEVELILNRENPIRSEGTFGVVENYYTLICRSQARNIFLGVLYGYKALLQVIALVFAFATRKVKVKGLNDGIYIATAVYITSLLWGIVIVSTYSLNEYLNIFTTVFNLGLLVGTTAIVGLIFIPKMVGLYKDPKGDTVFTSKTENTGSSSNVMALNATLRKRVKDLEGILSQSKIGGSTENL